MQNSHYYGYPKDIHELAESIIEFDIYGNQTNLIQTMMIHELCVLEDVYNLYDMNNEIKDIFEWWAVSEQLADLLRHHHQPVLSNEFGVWWGRTCTGQSIILDGTIQKIVGKIEAST